jgi:predicted DNA-binding transcriptional regulator AlpA
VETPTHINQRQLAKRWGVSERSIERYRTEGTGPCYLKINGRVVYSVIDVEAWEQSRKRLSTSQGAEEQAACH